MHPLLQAAARNLQISSVKFRQKTLILSAIAVSTGFGTGFHAVRAGEPKAVKAGEDAGGRQEGGAEDRRPREITDAGVCSCTDEGYQANGSGLTMTRRQADFSPSSASPATARIV